MSIYHDGFLHTNSSYFGRADFFSEGTETFKAMFRVDSIIQDYKEAYDYAKAREIAFYQKFFPGVTEYEVFIEKMREIFDKADRAGQKISQLKNASLKKDYIIKNDKETINYKITLTKEGFEKVNSGRWKTDGLIIESEPLYLSLDKTADIEIMKKTINYIKGIAPEFEEKFNPFNRKHIRNTSYFKPGSLDTKALETWLRDELDMENGIFEKELIQGVTISADPPSGGNGSSTTQTFSEKLNAKDLPFSRYTATEINAALASGDKEMKKKATQAVEDVHNFLLNRLDISENDKLLKEAFDLAWGKVDKDFFFEGDNLIKGVLGTPGEFALDIALNYAALAAKNFSGKLGQIVGDVVRNGRGQGRSDYEIMVSLGADMGRDEKIGIQVKNVDAAGYDDIEVNTDLGLMLPNLGENVVTSIANYQFNASIASMVGNMKGFLSKYLNNYIWRGLNFNVKEDLDPGNTNTFYFLGGDKLIPVSEIIYRLYNNKKLGSEYTADKLMKTPETTVSGLTRGKDTDASFEVGEPPKFTRYWHGNKDIDWEPDPENQALFQSLLMGIRVKSSLNFASFLQVSGGNYEIFR